MVIDATGDDLDAEVLEVGRDDRAEDRVAAADELVAGVVDDVGVKVARELRRVALVQGVKRAVHDEQRADGHGPIVLEPGWLRVGNPP